MRYASKVLLFALALLPVQGQVTTGSISGYVTDPSQNAISEAVVRINLSGREVTRQARTGIDGFYRLLDLSPGSWKLTATAQGFDRVHVDEIRVEVNSDSRVDVSMPVAGRKESVSVRARVSALPKESAELGAVFTQARIQALPLNQRDFLQLALLAPGVLPPVQGSELSTRGSFAMHANGGREEFNNYLLDGVDNNDQDTNRYVVQPPVDAIQEFKIATNSYSAEYGRNAGGQVNVITRSGSNQWHRMVYDYLRNRDLDARNFFDGSAKPQYVRNQFGVGAGGPMIKHRTFLFVDFDGLRERQGLTRLATVPTGAERSGDLSALGLTLADPYTGSPFPGSRVPASRVDPLAVKVLALFPLPDLPGSSGNYLAQPILRNSQTQANARLDHRVGSADEITLRYSYGEKNLFEPYAESSTNIPGYGDYLRDDGHNALLSYVRAMGTAAINSVRLGFNRAGRRLYAQNYATDVNKAWGVDWLPTRDRDFGFPFINVNGYSPVGDVTQLPIDRQITTYQLSDIVSLFRGTRDLKLGFELRRIGQNGILDVYPRGSISFLGAISGAGIADLLLGLPTFGVQAQSDNPQHLRTTATDVYAQYDWKARKNLAVNFGVRYEYNTAPTDPDNQMSIYDLDTSSVVRVGTAGISRSGISPDRADFAPRVGVAWSPFHNTAIRSGYGWYYDAGTLVVNSSLYFNPPYFNIRVFSPTATAPLSLSDPFPTAGAFAPPPSLNSLSPDLHTGYLQHWSFNIQQELSGLATLSVAYAGSKGTRLIRSRDLNQPSPGPGDVQPRRPNPAFGDIFFIESGANSNFNALEISLNRDVARGLSLWAVYMVSKSIDDTSAFLGTIADPNFPQDSRNYRAERALSSFDIRQRLTLAHVYRIPLQSPWARNFEFRGILTAETGQPFTPILLEDNSNTGNTGGSAGSDRPDLLRSPALAHPGPDLWFDPKAFAIAPPDRFGSAGRNILRGPGLFSWDLSLARRFAIGESRSLSLEAQAFNAFNRSNFDLPERYADEPNSFGRIFSAKAPRQIQIALRFTF